jgi:hypothetical protein
VTTYDAVTRARVRVRRPARTVAALAGRAWRKARPYALPVTGFGLLTAAASSWHVWAGLVVAGAACFILDYNSGSTSRTGGQR